MNNRRTGKTTRIIDRIIQQLFKDGKGFIYEFRHDIRDTCNLKNKVVRRLSLEHPNVKFKLIQETKPFYHIVITLEKEK